MQRDEKIVKTIPGVISMTDILRSCDHDDLGEMAFRRAPRLLRPLWTPPVDTRITFSRYFHGVQVTFRDNTLDEPRIVVKEEKEVFDDWYDLIGSSLTNKLTALRFGRVTPDYSVGRRYVRSEEGVFEQTSYEVYDTSSLTPYSRAFLQNGIVSKQAWNWLEVRGSTNSIRLAITRVEKYEHYVFRLEEIEKRDPLLTVEIEASDWMVEPKPKFDSVLLHTLELIPSKMCLVDVEQIAAEGRQVPWAAATVVISNNRIESHGMYYFPETAGVARRLGRLVDNDRLISMDDFRRRILDFHLNGFVIVAKGASYEFMFLNNNFSPVKNNTEGNRFIPLKSWKWQIPVVDLQCLPYDELYPHYSSRLSSVYSEYYEKDYKRMGHKDKGHVPVMECLLFWQHWRAVETYILSKCKMGLPTVEYHAICRVMKDPVHDLQLLGLNILNPFLPYASPYDKLSSVASLGPNYVLAAQRLLAIRSYLMEIAATELRSGLDWDMVIPYVQQDDVVLTQLLELYRPKMSILKIATTTWFKGQKNCDRPSSFIPHLRKFGWVEPSTANRDGPVTFIPSWTLIPEVLDGLDTTSNDLVDMRKLRLGDQVEALKLLHMLSSGLKGKSFFNVKVLRYIQEEIPSLSMDEVANRIMACDVKLNHTPTGSRLSIVFPIDALTALETAVLAMPYHLRYRGGTTLGTVVPVVPTIEMKALIRRSERETLRQKEEAAARRNAMMLDVRKTLMEQNVQVSQEDFLSIVRCQESNLSNSSNG